MGVVAVGAGGVVLAASGAILAFTIVAGDAATLEPTETTSAGKACDVVHEVARGETLSNLAGRYLGDFRKYPMIFASNREILSDPDRVRAGDLLRIPCQ